MTVSVGKQLSFRLITGLLLLLLFPLGPARAEETGADWCGDLMKWVEANRANLPRTYEEISALHPVYRRAIYGYLPAETKSALWRAQFERYLSGSQLTGEQRSLLLESLQWVTPRTFVLLDGKNRPARARLVRYLEDFDARAQKAFGRERAQEIFSTLGPASVEDRFFSSPQAPLAISTDVEPPPPPPEPVAGPVACSCSRSHTECPSGYTCTGNHACNRITNGCGPIYARVDCDGLCEKPEPFDEDPVEINP
jgi:hypothetical protein